MEKHTTPDLGLQIERYRQLFGIYENYAKMLNDFFKNACQDAIPTAIIQTRAKTLSSFAEKAIRKADAYLNPIEQFGDLCGARIVVHTNDQVIWVSEFIEKNFIILEKEDVHKRLGENQFGYLSIHYNVKIKPRINYEIPKKLLKDLAGKKAEIQVKTILQHAWSDVLHDRTYKNKIDLPENIRRSSAVLAALLEEGDEKFAQVVEIADSYFLNYSAYMTRKEIKAEIETLTKILEMEPDEKNKPATALKLARLISLESTDCSKVIKILEPLVDVMGKGRFHLILELGKAYCMMDRIDPDKGHLTKGQELFEKVIQECKEDNSSFVIDKSHHSSLKAQARSMLACSYKAFPEKLNKVSEHYHDALSHEPFNPYYLAESLGYSTARKSKQPIPKEMHILIDKAIETCRQHALAGIELPQAYFTRGRLYLLKEEYDIAYGFYARGIRHFLDKEHFSPAGALETEASWLNLLALQGDNENIDFIRTLLLLGRTMAGSEEAKKELFEMHPAIDFPGIQGQVLIMAGGASKMKKKVDIETARRLIETMLENFEGTIISGGTTVGIPGLVEKVAKKLKEKGRRIRLVGYIPRHLPKDAQENKNYDKIIECKGQVFSADQLHQSWTDIIRAGIEPKDVMLIGVNGGDISALEYRLAAALGARTGIVSKTGRAAEKLSKESDWQDVPNLMFIPNDPASLSLFISQERWDFKPEKLEELARLVHENYLNQRIKGDKDPSLKFWDNLDVSLKESNRQQAQYAIFNLRKVGFGVKQIPNPNPDSVRIDDDEIELLAELEHGRWNAERLLDGWRYGPEKNAKEKISPYIVSWKELPDNIRKYDREAVAEFPNLLAKGGLEIFRMEDQQEIIAQTRKLLASKFEFHL